jgi:hypothetical protein
VTCALACRAGGLQGRTRRPRPGSSRPQAGRVRPERTRTSAVPVPPEARDLDRLGRVVLEDLSAVRRGRRPERRLIRLRAARGELRVATGRGRMAASRSAGSPGLTLLGAGGQGLVACALLEAALELFRRCRCCSSWMPNDPYDLANAPAPTARSRRPFGGGRALAVRAAVLTDHVCDRWHGRAASQASISRWEEAHAGCGRENPRNLHGSGRESIRSNGRRSPVMSTRSGKRSIDPNGS